VAAIGIAVADLEQAIRTQAKCSSDDDRGDNAFDEAEYIGRNRFGPSCLPLVKTGKVIGVAVSRKQTGAHVVTPARIALLKLLGTAAIRTRETIVVCTNRRGTRGENPAMSTPTSWFSSGILKVGFLTTMEEFCAWWD